MLVHEGLVVVVYCGDWRVFTLVMDFKEVILTSPPEMAHCNMEGQCHQVETLGIQNQYTRRQ